MRSRDIQVNFRVSEDEYQRLLELSSRTGRSITGILRLMINGYVVPERPSRELLAAVNQLYAMGNLLSKMSESSSYSDELTAMREKIEGITKDLRENFLSTRKLDIQSI